MTFIAYATPQGQLEFFNLSKATGCLPSGSNSANTELSMKDGRSITLPVPYDSVSPVFEALPARKFITPGEKTVCLLLRPLSEGKPISFVRDDSINLDRVVDERYLVMAEGIERITISKDSKTGRSVAEVVFNHGTGSVGLDERNTIWTGNFGHLLDITTFIGEPTPEPRAITAVTARQDQNLAAKFLIG